MNRITGPTGPHQEPQRIKPKEPETALPPSQRPAEAPPPAAFKVDKSHVTSRLYMYGQADEPFVSGLKIAITAAFDPGGNGDKVRQAMKRADPAALRASLQIKRSDGKSPWDRMEPRVRDLVAGDYKARSLAFKGFASDLRIEGLVHEIKKNPKGEIPRRFQNAVDNLGEGQALQAEELITAADRSPDPIKEGRKWAELFHQFVSGNTLHAFI